MYTGFLLCYVVSISAVVPWPIEDMPHFILSRDRSAINFALSRDNLIYHAINSILSRDILHSPSVCVILVTQIRHAVRLGVWRRERSETEEGRGRGERKDLGDGTE